MFKRSQQGRYVLLWLTHAHTAGTHWDCRPSFAEKEKPADTWCILSEKWDTHQPPDPQLLTSPFQTAFLLLSEADKFIPLVSKQSPLFFFLLHQWKKKGVSRRQEGWEKYICPTELHYRHWANVLCVRAPGTGRLSYNSPQKAQSSALRKSERRGI